MVIGGDGAEVDWIVGYGPPAENFQAKLEKVLKGENTFKVVNAAYAANPKDVATVFKLARKWTERYDDAKSSELYKQVIALDPQGKDGFYTNEYTGVSVPYTEFAEYTLASQGMRPSAPGQKPDFSSLQAFIAKYPNGKMTKQAWMAIGRYYSGQAPKEEAAKFFEEYAGKYPYDPAVLNMWLGRIIRDKEPLDKGAELAERIIDLTQSNPSASMNMQLAQFYLLKGDKEKADRLFGPDFIDGQVSNLGYNLVSYANFWLGQNANLDNAVAMAEMTLKLEPDNSYFLQQVAQAYVKTGKDDKALALFGPAYMQKNIADDSALYSYASFWARQGENLDSALAAAKKAVEIKGNTYYYWAGLSSVQEKMKNVPEAVQAMEKAIELAPDAVKETYKKTLERLKNLK
jgi:tetratricopeptide (TPR) repeat protein